MRWNAFTSPACSSAAAGAGAAGAGATSAGAAGAAAAGALAGGGAPSWAIAIPKLVPTKSAPINNEAIRFMPRPLLGLDVLVRCDYHAGAPLRKHRIASPKTVTCKVPHLLLSPVHLTNPARALSSAERAPRLRSGSRR